MHRLSSLIRSRKTLSVLVGASSVAAAAQLAQAQTWVNPNSGSWSVGTNWIGGTPPTSSASTQIAFNATGTQSYTSFNNIANPFTLGTRTKSAVTFKFDSEDQSGPSRPNMR